MIHLNEDGTAEVVLAKAGARPLRDGEGDVLFSKSNGMSVRLFHRTAEGDWPVMVVGRDAVFVGDTLYGVDFSAFSAVRSGGEPVTRPLPEQVLRAYGWTLLAAPNGSLYMLSNSAGGLGDYATAFLVDPENYTFTPALEFNGVRAFDAAGRGYFIVNHTLVERRDFMSGESVIVAQLRDGPDADRIVKIAMSGRTLYALTQGPGGQTFVEKAPLDGPGFDGFHPPFSPRPPPDLVVEFVSSEVVATTVRDGFVEETRILTLAVSNEGIGPASPSILRAACWSPQCGLAPVESRVWTPIIAAGASAEVEMTWVLRGAVPGDRRVFIHVDEGNRVMESDEDNNYVAAQVPFLVGGTHDACYTAMEGAGLPRGFCDNG